MFSKNDTILHPIILPLSSDITPTWISTIRKQGDLLEERIHPDNKAQLIEHQIEHGQFIYSLPQEQRNDYRQIFQIRMLNAQHEYVNVISHHQMIQKDI